MTRKAMKATAMIGSSAAATEGAAAAVASRRGLMDIGRSCTDIGSSDLETQAKPVGEFALTAPIFIRVARTRLEEETRMDI
jgi:hypothetical protein